MTILVTGANGTTGKAVVQALQQRGIATRALVRDPAKAGDLVGMAHVEVVYGNLADAQSLQQALRGVTAAYLVSNAGPEAVTLQNGFVDAARQAGVARVVKHSGMGAHADSPIALARWHAASEAHLQASGLQYTILRPHFFMQNLLWDAAAIREQGAIFAPMADAAFSLIDARDIADVAATVLIRDGHHGRIYDLTGPAAVSYHDIADRIGRATGRAVRYVAIDGPAYRAGAQQMGLPEWLINDMLSMFSYFASGAAAEVTPWVRELAGHSGRDIGQFAQDYAGAFIG